MSSTITCLECSKQLKSINDLHLVKKHGMTTKQYLEKHPGASVMSEETREKVRQKMLGREITWKAKISSATKEAMARPDVKEKFQQAIAVREAARREERIRS